MSRLQLQRCTRAGFYKAALGEASAIIEVRSVSYGAIYGFDETTPNRDVEGALARTPPRRLARLVERAS